MKAFPLLPALFLCGVFLQCLALAGGGAAARLLLASGAALVALCGAEERDITLLVGQIGVFFALWRIKFHDPARQNRRRG